MTRFVVAIAIASALLLAGGAPAQDKYSPKMTLCSMKYNLKGWSFVYKTAKGEGSIKCDNGQRAEVNLESHGGGFTAGKSEIIGGEANFTEVKDVKDLFGTYASAEAHAGATKSGAGAVLTKGEVSLTLGGTGEGIDIGISLGGLKISPK